MATSCSLCLESPSAVWIVVDLTVDLHQSFSAASNVVNLIKWILSVNLLSDDMDLRQIKHIIHIE